MSDSLDIFLFNSCSSDLCSTGYTVLLDRIKDISRLVSSKVKELKGFEINVIIADGRTMRGLNKRFRRVDSSTDVLAFPFDEPGFGEIWLCPSVIEKNAKKYNQSFDLELIRVLIHGMLHLGGYDHKGKFISSSVSKEKMFRVQEQILSGLV
ncbi:rRNA maturation RNase YbeY [Candidatus Dojkabacteria bacterium]|nr:rRNA maturation RNase YbeY [Candidatus Dojkabacteria bacterium]